MKITNLPIPEPELLTDRLLDCALAAGRRIMEIYGDDIAVRHKSDSSPVTEADEAAEAVILEALERLTPAIPVIAEERVSRGEIPTVGSFFWLVDPLDGTREFINRNGEFTVNIGLIADRVPVLGIVYAPACNRLFFGSLAAGAFEAEVDARAGTVGSRRPITVRMPPDEGLTVVASRSHRDPETDALISAVRVHAFKPAGSSLKFCLVAAGEADFYPRTGRTMEWDVAAGHAVLSAAGGTMTQLDGSPFLYGKAGFENPGFIVRGRLPG